MTTASKVIDTEGLENEGLEEESGFLYDQRKRHSRLTFFLLLDAPDKILLQFRDRHQLFQIPLPQCPLMICLKGLSVSSSSPTCEVSFYFEFLNVAIISRKLVLSKISGRPCLKSRILKTWG